MIDLEMKLYEEMEAAFKLGKFNLDGMPNDDTQLGVEFAMKFYKPYIDRLQAAENLIQLHKDAIVARDELIAQLKLHLAKHDKHDAGCATHNIHTSVESYKKIKEANDYNRQDVVEKHNREVEIRRQSFHRFRNSGIDNEEHF